MYEGKCNFGENSIGETGRNVTIRWDEQSDIGKTSEPAKHLNQFPTHRFNRKILREVPNRVTQKKIHEAYYVMCIRPTINNQLEHRVYKVSSQLFVYGRVKIGPLGRRLCDY